MFRGGMKLKERFILGASVVAVLFTFLLVVDIQMDLGMSGHHLVPSHGRVKYVQEEGGGSAYNSFRKRYLQKTHSSSTNASKESLPPESAPNAIDSLSKRPAAITKTKEKHDDFSDLVDYIMLDSSEKEKHRVEIDRVHPVVQNTIEMDSLKEDNPTIGEIRQVPIRPNATTLEQFHLGISQHQLYPANSPLVDDLLRQMANDHIVHVSQKSGGTQLKLVIDYINSLQALFKPMRFPREQQTLPNHFYFTDYERHNAEIAAFHLDRLLGFRRAMPVTGRLLNMTTDLYQKAEGDLLKTFFVSPSDNMCFHGKCTYYCDTSHAICGNPDSLEGSFAAFLPSNDLAARKSAASHGQQHFPGGGEIVREALHLQGYPENAIETSLKAISSTTLRQYTVTYKEWWQHCQVNSIPVFSASVPQVITFLQHFMDRKKVGYGSINTHRSALSLILQGDIGNDKRIKRFMKGAAKLRPLTRKYDSIWDPLPVLSYLSKKFPNRDLPLEDLTLKLVTLLALITGHRIQTLSLIKLSNIVVMPSGFQIYISDTIKTSGTKNPQPCLQIPLFAEQPELCVATTLQDYIEKTRSLRIRGQDALFITIKKPHTIANKQTISKWIKKSLALAGIDTCTFSSHSTRHAATSAAFRQGVSIEIIKRTAGWSENSAVFAKFYNRPLTQTTTFAKSILTLAQQE